MAQLTLTVQGNFKPLEDQYKVVKQALEGKPITIKVDSQGAQASLNGVTGGIKNVSSAAQAASAETQKMTAVFKDEKVAKTIKQTSTAIGETTKEITTFGKKGQSVTVEITRNFQQQSKYIDQCRVAYAQYAAEMAKRTPITPIQQRINEMVGIGNTPKSAEDSALFFEKQFAIPKTTAYNLKEAEKAARDAAQETTKGLKGTLDQYVQWYLRWTLTANAFKAVVSNIKESLAEMKKVDTELTNIQKVSDLTAQEIGKIGDAAYETASKYGVSASEYLKAVYTFQKAGIGDNSSKMGELATKTMLVGDTTMEVATRFLIASNAAWKFGGNIEELSRLVDEADKLNNTYAVSLSDIATGLPIVAATAAQAGMSAEQTMAAISTIVASTGQSASKAATALRAIIMNLIGETGELEDGTKVTEETIKSLNGVLQKYAADSLKAADAAGKVLDPMEAIAALAKAAEDGFLNEAELFETLAGLGGKLRTTQLAALVNNTEMYNNMLRDTAGAAGTADREVSIMLDSWESRTQILKNTWTQFISNLVETRDVKNAISALTGVVKMLDSDFGRFAITLGTVAATIALLNHAIPLFLTKLVGSSSLAAAITLLSNGMITLGEAATVLWTALSTNPLFWVAAGAAAIYGLVKLVDVLVVTAEEHVEAMQDAIDKYNELQGEIDSINSKISDNNKLIAEANELGKSDTYIKRLETENTLLETQKTLKETLAKQEKERIAQEARAALNSTYGYLDPSQTRNVFMGNGEADYYPVAVQQKYADAAEHLLDLADAGYKVDEQLQDVFKVISDVAGKLDEVADKGTIDRISELTNRYAEFNGVITDQGKAIANLRHKYNDARNAAADILRSEEAKKAGFDKTTGSIRQQIAALAELYRTKAQEAGTSFDDDAIGRQLRSNDPTYKKWINLYYTAASALQNMDIAEQRIKDAMGDGGGSGSTGGSSGGGTGGGKGSTKSGSGEDPVLKGIKAQIAARKQSIADLKAELALMQERGDSAEAQVAKMREIQAAENAEADYLRENKKLWGELSVSESDVLSLSTDWWKIQNDIQKMLAPRDALEGLKNIVTLRKDELSFMEASDDLNSKRVAKMREIQAALHDEAEYIRSTKEYQEAVAQQQKDEKELTADQVKLLQSVTSLSEEWWKYQEKIKNTLSDAEQELKRIKDAIKDVTDDINDLIDAEENSATSALRRQLELLKAQKEEVDETRELQEKLLAVEKARVALANAQNDRNVRIWNAAAGQWQWVANASNVKSAQESLKKAEQDLSGYYRSREISTLEKNISTIEKSYDGLRDAIKNFTKEIDKGTVGYADAVSKLLSAFSGTALESLVSQIVGMLPHASGLTFSGNNAIGYTPGSPLYWYNPDTQEWEAVVDDFDDFDDDDDDDNEGWWDSSTYDSGGILRGKGGIKATGRDEMVLPPNTTAQLLAAEQTGAFNALLDHLGIVTSAAGAYAGFNGSISANRIGTQNNGDTYNLGGISISETQARGMSVYDLAQMARGLRLNDRIV